MEEIELQGHTFPLDGAQAALMESTPAALVADDPAALRAQFERQGYVLVRSLLPRPLVAAVEDEIRALAAADPQEGLGRGMLPRPHADAMMNSATFRRVSHGPELFALFDALFDEPSVTLDYKHFRAVGPAVGTPFHMSVPSPHLPRPTHPHPALGMCLDDDCEPAELRR